jgi:hypothetical protein
VLGRLAGAVHEWCSAARSRSTTPPTPDGRANYMQLLVARASLTGFVVFDYAARYGDGVASSRSCCAAASCDRARTSRGGPEHERGCRRARGPWSPHPRGDGVIIAHECREATADSRPVSRSSHRRLERPRWGFTASSSAAARKGSHRSSASLLVSPASRRPDPGGRRPRPGATREHRSNVGGRSHVAVVERRDSHFLYSRAGALRAA